MNSILQLKGRFESRANPTRPGAPKLPNNKNVNAEHLRDLSEQIKDILEYWKINRDIDGALVSVHYNQVVAKSNRLKILLSKNSNAPTDSIRGAKFTWENGKQKHIFTYFLSLEALEKTVKILNKAAYVLDEYYGGNISSQEIDEATNLYMFGNIMAKTTFLQVVVDAYYVERFDIDRIQDDIEETSIITIYKTGVETKRLLAKFGINIVDDRMLDETTLRLNADEIKLLINNASYLIAMSLTDFSKISKFDVIDKVSFEEVNNLIPKPNNEPTIGVIDTQFNKDVYFSEWVEYTNMLDENIEISDADRFHGTAVSSIIVDGSRGNPNLDDGCGRFRVRHFGVATNKGFSSFFVLKMIRNIVATNRDIKVWNLSLGSTLEIKDNFISPEAAELDKIQSEYDVIFVVAGTNIPDEINKKEMKIGAPADSLNSMVVNSVDFSGQSASYTRIGPVLSFFHKPDVSYYGGDGKEIYNKIVVNVDNTGAYYVKGTSFAAPWIARKLAYLIEVMQLNRETAKALLIDSAAGWDRKDDYTHKIGYGIVPVHINDILHTSKDEIRFVMTGSADEYETYTYNLPIPMVNNAFPFYARATLAYFPVCDRNQGVDYTGTEMDVHFGRLQSKKGKATIKSIDDNKQSEEEKLNLPEENMRKLYRKWDNVKHISEEIKERRVPRKTLGFSLWGLSVKTKERTKMYHKEKGLQFGVVVTLKEMNGKNRIDDFIKLCMARGWLVNVLDVQNQIDIYAKAEETIKFE